MSKKQDTQTMELGEQPVHKITLPPEPDTLPARRSQSSAYAVIMEAVKDNSCDPAKLRELLAVRREWNTDEAAAEFNAAVVTFQKRCQIVAKDDTANGRAYARMDRIWRAIRPLLDECGLAVTWESVKVVADVCVLDGHLRHSRGHAQPLHHEIPLPEKIPAQNAAQRAGAAETYAKRYATCAALGVQTGVDDDGGQNVETVTQAQAHQLGKAIAASGTDAAKLFAWAGCTRAEDFPAGKFTEAMGVMAGRMKGGAA